MPLPTAVLMTAVAGGICDVQQRPAGQNHHGGGRQTGIAQRAVLVSVGEDEPHGAGRVPVGSGLRGQSLSREMGRVQAGGVASIER